MDLPGGQPAGRATPAAAVASEGVTIPGPTGQRMVVKLSGRDTSGAYSLIEYSHAARAAGPPPHVHHRHEEGFFVLDGELTLAVGAATITVAAGRSAVVPRGTVHRPSNASDRPVRFIFICSPPMDDFFVELGELVTRTDGQPSAVDLRELGERHDSTFTDLPATDVVGIRNEHDPSSYPD
jgi:mannose-6-phosphate isomerase-like protein (cupin superfamily)